MERHHIYILPSSGRINIGAVTDRNIHKVAKAIADVVLHVKC
jgi:aspartate/tyrosine/aromatic aminotransferase